MTIAEKFDKLNSYIQIHNFKYVLEIDLFGYFMEIKYLDLDLAIFVNLAHFSNPNLDQLLDSVIHFLESKLDNVVNLQDFR